MGDADRTEALLQTAGVWTLVLAIDFLVSFSYTLFPRRRGRGAARAGGSVDVAAATSGP